MNSRLAYNNGIISISKLASLAYIEIKDLLGTLLVAEDFGKLFAY